MTASSPTRLVCLPRVHLLQLYDKRHAAPDMTKEPVVQSWEEQKGCRTQRTLMQMSISPLRPVYAMQDRLSLTHLHGVQL